MQTSGIAHGQRTKGSSSKSTAARRERRQQKSVSEIRRKGAFFEGELASQGPTQLQERFTVRAEEQTTRNTIHEKQNKQNTKHRNSERSVTEIKGESFTECGWSIPLNCKLEARKGYGEEKNSLD